MNRFQRPVKVSVFLLATLLLTGCFETKTSDPAEAYKGWSGSPPEKDLQVINGYFWESAHWSKEYIVYLQLKPTRKWRNDFFKSNGFTQAGSIEIPSDAPSWFKPGKENIIFRKTKNGSYCWENKKTKHLYIYESIF